MNHRTSEVLDLPRRRGYQYVVRVRAPYHGARLVSFGNAPWRFVADDRYWLTFEGFDEPMLLAPGFPVVTGGTATPLVTAPGPGERISVMLDPSTPARVESRRVPTTPLTVDGEFLDVPVDYRSTVAATFSGHAGQYVHLQRHSSSDAFEQPIVLFGPGHRALDWNRYDDVYRLPYTGTYTAVPMSASEQAGTYAFRPAGLEDVGEVTVDGAPLVVDARPDGRLVMAHLVGATWERLAYGAVNDATLSNGGWQVFAGILERCGSHSSSGCGDYGWTYLTPEVPASQLGFYGTLVLVDTDSSATGSLVDRVHQHPTDLTNDCPQPGSRLHDGAVLQRLGFPEVGRHRRFVTAIGIDAVGSGVWMPVSMIFFLATTDLSLVQVGLALSLASLLSLPAAVLVGQQVDRFGSKTILQSGNALQAASFVLYPFVDQVWSVALVVSASVIGRTAFWGSYSPMVTVISPPGEREKWFGFLGALRNAGFAIGGVVAGAALTVDATWLYYTVALLNAASYALSFVLLAGVSAHDTRSGRARRPGRGGRRLGHRAARPRLPLAGRQQLLLRHGLGRPQRRDPRVRRGDARTCPAGCRPRCS